METEEIHYNMSGQRCPDGQEWSSREDKCVPCPGGKIRSGGTGRGLGIGKGRGPLGVPVGRKSTEVNENGISRYVVREGFGGYKPCWRSRNW